MSRTPDVAVPDIAVPDADVVTQRRSAGDTHGDVLSGLQTFATVAAPTTLVAALLFYFGYVSTLVRYEYFGVDLNALDLSTIDLVLLGTEVIYPPLAGLFVLILACVLAHRGVQALIRRSPTRAITVMAILITILGAALFARAAVGLLVVSVARQESPGTTAICLGLGLPLAAYGTQVWRQRKGAKPIRGKRSTADILLASGLVGVTVLGLFWATNQFAAAYGRGRAHQLASELGTRPLVVLDLEQQLYLPEGIEGVQQFPLRDTAEQKFRIRCQGLRLLTESGGRLFLVPAKWDGSARRTIVVPYDDSVRIQFVAN